MNTKIVYLARIIFFFVVLQFTSLRPLFKYLPTDLHSLIPIYLGLLLIGYFFFLYALKKHSVVKRLNSPLLTFFIISAITLIGYSLFQYQLSLQAVGRGSDSSYALIQGGQNLIRGLYPYAEHTYFGNPISTGPGWLLLTFPFAHNVLYPLLTPTLLVCFAFTTRHILGHWYTTNVFLLFLASSLAFWELLGSGIDLLPLGLAFTIVLILSLSSKKTLSLVILAIIAGLLATSRSVFFYTAPLIGFLRYKTQHLKFAFSYILISLIIAIGLHLFFFYWTDYHYAPLHLLNKGGYLLPTFYKYTALIASFLVGFYIVTKPNKNRVAGLWKFWLSLFVPLLFVSIGDLQVRDWHFSEWEGANYITLTLPLFIAWFVFNQDNRHQ